MTGSEKGSLYGLGVCEAVARLRDGSLSSRDLTAACLERIKAFDPEIEAWVFLDPEHAMAQAEACDRWRQKGHPVGPLHGLPIAVKDIIETRDMPTEYGCSLYKGNRSGQDATVVAKLRAAGAVILGKTVTTEFAVYRPSKTKNPHDPGRTPGGSSSGSAAAVASFMAPAALGTQTNGSVIRPAAYCGVYGFKPSFGSISRAGVLGLSSFLDQVGLMARSVEDIAAVGDVLCGYDAQDPGTAPPSAGPDLLARAREEAPVPPKFAFVKTAQWAEAEPVTHEAFEQMAAFLGDRITAFELPREFDEGVEALRRVMWADLAKNLAKDYDRGREQLDPQLCHMIEEGAKITAVDYNRARDLRGVLQAHLDEIFDAFDGLLTPATAGEAPLGLESTGSPAFCSTWTFIGAPALSLPLLRGEAGLPIGVQLVGQRGDDGRLLRSANWLAKRFEETLDEDAA